MNTEDSEFARIEREQAMRNVPDAIHHTDSRRRTMDEHTYTFKQPSEQMLGFFDTKPNSNITFLNNGKQVGVLDFNGPEMTFTGDAEESAKVFFDFIAKSFKARLDQERADEREACAKECEGVNSAKDYYGERPELVCAEAIRARGQA